MIINWTLVLTAATGVILFLYGIENFSREIQRAAGNTLRRFISKATKNRIYSLITGAGVTGFIQSSTATTIITVSLVNSGIISFAQSLAVIIGANIGTTLTAQLIAFNFGIFAPIFLVAGFLISLASKKYKFLGRGLFYFGLVFFSLNLISAAIEPIKDSQWILNLTSSASNIFLGLLIGFAFTAIVHSSAVTAGIVVILASSNLISLQQSIPILLGANIGTTVTTLTASLKLNLYAKRAAVAHFLFNLIGALIFLPIIIPFARLIEILGGAPANQVANAHTIFNIVVALLFIFWLKVFSRLIEKIIPGKEEEILFKTKYINEKVPKKINDALLLIEKEMKYSLEITKKMFKKSYLLLKEHSPKEHDKLKRLESLDDLLDQSIESFLMDIAKKELSSKESKKILLLVRISNAIEQLGDLADDLGSLPQKLEDEGIKIPKDSKLGINELYKKFETLLQKTVLKFPQPLSKQEFNKELSNEFSLLQEEYYFHMQRAMKRKSITGSIFVESASIIESSLTKLGEIIELTEEYEKVR